MKHLIRKQVISLHVNAGQNAFSIQHRCNEYFYQQLLPVMEKLFDELSSENEILSIDKLEIDLGNLTWKNDHLTADEPTIYRAIKDSLHKAIVGSGETSGQRDEVVRRSPEETACVQWLYYMENGVLPWELQSTGEAWAVMALHQLAIDVALIQKTKKLILENNWFLARIVKEHTGLFLRQLTEVITAKKQADLIVKIKTAARDFNADATPTLQTEKRIWQEVLKQAARGHSEIDIHHALTPDEKTTPNPFIQPVQQADPGGIFCRYAGLVLLHPFFKHLFKHLGLLQDGIFANIVAREKAVALLYLIATGQTEADDYELVVPKILCGVPLHEVIEEQAFMLTSEEQEEALNMMHAAIAQWTILSNTSPDGLREGFLARDGKLVVKENGIELRIEASAIDVLLDHLPWNLSVVKLPWLNEFIRVEWR